MTRIGYLLTLPVLFYAGACHAQFSAVVFDMETRRQIEGVTVHVNPRGTTTTDKGGRFVINGGFNSLTLARQGYESLSLAKSDLRDTLWMLPNGRRLDEIVVIGYKPKIGFKIGNKPQNGYNAPKSNGLLDDFDFFDAVNFKKKKQKKRRKKIQEILDDY